MQFITIALTLASSLLATASPIASQEHAALVKRDTDLFYILASGGGAANGKYAAYTSANLSPVNFTASRLSQASKFYITNDGYNTIVAASPDGRPPAVVLGGEQVQLRASGSQTSGTNLITCTVDSSNQLSCRSAGTPVICGNTASWFMSKTVPSGCATVSFSAIYA